MKFEFDPAKNAKNIAKHRISFERAEELEFEHLVLKEDTRFEYAERRFIGYGLLDDRVYSLCFTRIAKGHIRIISFRRAHWKEVAFYEEEIEKE